MERDPATGVVREPAEAERETRVIEIKEPQRKGAETVDLGNVAPKIERPQNLNPMWPPKPRESAQGDSSGNDGQATK